jgi:hypothetical protein
VALGALVSCAAGCGSDASSAAPPADGGPGPDGSPGGRPREPVFLDARAFASPERQDPQEVAVDPSGNIYLLGRASGTLDFGGGVSVTASDVTYPEYFLAKVDRDAHPLWAKSLGVWSDESAATFGLDASGNVVLLRQYRGSLTIEDHAFETSPSATRSALLSIAPSGALNWAHSHALRTCRLHVAATGAFVVAGCSPGADFGTGEIDAPYLSGTTGFFDATGQVQKVLVEPYPCAHEMTPDGSFLVFGNRFELDHLAGTPIPATDGERTAYLARLDATGSVASVQSFAHATAGNVFCDLIAMEEGSILGTFKSSSTSGVSITLGEASFEGPLAFFRFGADGALAWVENLPVERLIRSRDDNLVMVAHADYSDSPYVFGSAVLPNKNQAIDEGDAIVLGMDKDHAVQWASRIESAGNAGPFAAIDPTDGSVVLFGLVYEDTVEVPGVTSLIGEEDGDVYLMRLRAP